jgi:hypothetical protein
MFLIENEKGSFIDAEKIDTINVNGGKITFSVVGDSENSYSVSKAYEEVFLKHLKTLNNNRACNVVTSK